VPEELQEVYTNSCTQGQWVELAADLHTATLPSPPAQLAADPPRHYKVRRGDTLSAIARKYSCDDMGSLAKANHLHAPRFELKPGQELKLSGCGRE